MQQPELGVITIVEVKRYWSNSGKKNTIELLELVTPTAVSYEIRMYENGKETRSLPVASKMDAEQKFKKAIEKAAKSGIFYKQIF